LIGNILLNQMATKKATGNWFLATGKNN